MRKILGMMFLLAGTSVVALAQMPPPPPMKAPEINADAAGSALALVSGVVLVIRGRRAKR